MSEHPHMTPGNLALFAWIAFTTVFFFFSITYPLVADKINAVQIGNAQIQGYNIGVQNGQTSIVNALITQLDQQYKDGCKNAVPVMVGTGSIGITTVNCIQMLQAQAQQAVQAQQNQPAGAAVEPRR